MTNLSTTIAPKSDQLNSDDLIAGPITIQVTKVIATQSDQPISIFYEGDDDKPYKPCKSMRRVLVNAWGSDGSKYSGRSLMLYRDPNVKFGNAEVGGIRISHMTDIKGSVTMALTAARGSRKPYTVHPLTVASNSADGDTHLCMEAAKKGTEELQRMWKSMGGARQKAIADKLQSFKDIAASHSQSLPANDEESVAAQDPASEGAATDSRSPKQKAYNDGAQHASDGRSLRAMPPEYRSMTELSEAYTEGFQSGAE